MSIEFAVTRNAMVALDRPSWERKASDTISSPITYQITPEASWPGDRFVSLFQMDAAAVRAVERREDDRKVAALVVIYPPLSHEGDDDLIDLARESLTKALEGVE